ncbi:hypothetical protein [Mesorhizobium sp. WSM3224]|uniref:hypothetical protein n=1 Tax=Mesorhizobium sp. WSM3224 TaxID=1040986 RepID=UPI00040F8498|nr:hypothetical protein [Mesorhizobium sp. WSM3224]
MIISADDIARWAGQREAQGDLPKLLRRLIGRTATLSAVSMPAGNSVSVGGFDGELIATEGNAWVPRDKSIWELSVEANPRNKAGRDYEKRTLSVPEEVRRQVTFVAVTGRKWSRRGEWAKSKIALNQWKDVKAYDADDVELWLEQEPATQIWFAELLNLHPEALKSPERYWADWNRDVLPPISPEAVLASRNKEREKLFELFAKKAQGGTVVVHADSSEEAVAFACAAIIKSRDESSLRCVVVVNASGWNAIACSSNIDVAIAAETVVASAVPHKEGLVLLVPVATGNSEAHFPGHRSLDIDPDICLQRTLPEAYRDALVSMGLDQGDSERLALQCGRSWSVYRRIKNGNPAQKQPTWHEAKHAPVLTTLALIGAYLERNETDQKALEQMSGVSFDEFSAQAERLIRTDDSSIVRINGVVKAKSPLELFKMNEAGVSPSMFGRFVQVCEAVIGQLDPALDLPQEDRWLANVRGKIRPESGALFRSLADALPRIVYLSASNDWRWQISQLVKRLTSNVEKKNWLAISGVLRQLAEAAPDEFLQSLEDDLRGPSPQVYALFEETTSGGMGEACVYSDLLWALEILAWAPNRLLRVSKVLAQLTNAPSGGNWSNSPQKALLNIYRGWRPQTSATVEMRNRAMSALSKSHPKEAFDLCMGILHRGHDVAFSSSRPSWRDDDAGRTEVVTNVEYADVQRHAASMAFELANNSTDKAIKLFERYDMFDSPYRKRVLEAVTAASKTESVEELRKLRKALRHKLHWELNYGGKKREGLREKDISAIQNAYKDCEPPDLIEKHQWLFENYYCELPERDGRQTSEEAKERLKTLRTTALREIYFAQGFGGIEALNAASGSQNCIGILMHNLGVEMDAMIAWAAEKFGVGQVPGYVGEWLRSFGDEEREAATHKLLDSGRQHLRWDGQTILEFLRVCRCEPMTWEIVGTQSPEIQHGYWNGLPNLPYWLDLDPKKRGMQALLEHDNSAAALRSLRHCEEQFDGSEIADVLERNFATVDHALGDLQLHDIGDLVQAMEKSATLDRGRLLSLEFQMTAAFGQFAAELMGELQRELIDSPRQMLFAVSKAYKPDTGESAASSEQDIRLSTVCGHLLFYTTMTPGTQRDGSFSEEKCREYVEQLMALAKEEGYVKGSQLVLGTLLAHSPEADNGDWPRQCICEILDVPDNDRVRGTFQTGVFNKRGVTTRSPYDGGEQERELAAKFQRHAERWQIEFPLAAKALADIAESYRSDGLRNDRDAESSKERF